MTYPSNLFIRQLDTVGDGSGDKILAVKGDVAAKDFYLQPEEGKVYHIHRMMMFIQDGAVAFAPSTFGALSALTNGLLLQVEKVADDSVLFDLLDGEALKNNSHWGALAYDVRLDDYGGSSTDAVLMSRLSFDKFGGPLTLTSTERFRLSIRDDLTDLTEFHIILEGRIS